MKNILWKTLTFLVICFVSWAFTMAVAWILFFLFNIPFDFKTPTGVWAVLMLIDLYKRAYIKKG